MNVYALLKLVPDTVEELHARIVKAAARHTMNIKAMPSPIPF